jgi:hypothetical protein
MHCYVHSNLTRPREVILEHKTNTPEDALLMGKLVHLALPVRWSLVEQNRRGPVEMACTYDIHPRGARLLSSRKVKVGDLVMVERGRNKALCHVVWTGPRDSQLRGQFTVQCVDEGKTPWDDELRQMEEQYHPIVPKTLGSLSGMRSSADDNRRRRPRYFVEGTADVIDGVQRVEGEVQQLSELGARIGGKNLLRPGTDFRLLLNVFDVSLAVKAQVKYLIGNQGMGVEFQEIRRGDQPLLGYVLNKLRTLKREEEFIKVDVVNGMAATAG